MSHVFCFTKKKQVLSTVIALLSLLLLLLRMTTFVDFDRAQASPDRRLAKARKKNELALAIGRDSSEECVDRWATNEAHAVEFRAEEVCESFDDEHHECEKLN